MPPNHKSHLAIKSRDLAKSRDKQKNVISPLPEWLWPPNLAEYRLLRIKPLDPLIMWSYEIM